jgi:hypothetical protein
MSFVAVRRRHLHRELHFYHWRGLCKLDGVACLSVRTRGHMLSIQPTKFVTIMETFNQLTRAYYLWTFVHASLLVICTVENPDD